MYKRRLWKLFFCLTASVIVLAGVVTTFLFAYTLLTHANTASLPDVNVEADNYDAKQNMLSGRVKNNTNLPIEWADFRFTNTAGGVRLTKLTVRALQLKPKEQRAFRESCPPDWKNMGIGSMELSSQTMPSK